MTKLITPSEVNGKIVLSKFIEKINLILDYQFSGEKKQDFILIDLMGIASRLDVQFDDNIKKMLMEEFKNNGWNVSFQDWGFECLLKVSIK